MNRFTRLTLVGSVRRADVVVPSDEELAVLVPGLLELVEEPPASGSVALVRPTGEQLDVTLDAEALDLADGEILRIVRTQDAPPPAEVADVTEAASDALDAHGDRWGERSRRISGAVGVGLLTGAAGLLGAASFTGERSTLALALSAVVVLLLVVAATVTARAGWFGLAAGSAAAGLAPATALAVGPVLPDSSIGVSLPLALVVGWAALAATSGIARRDRGALIGAGLGIVLSLLWLGLGWTDLPTVRSAAVLAVVAVVLLGALPWFALTAAGVHRLDDAALEGVEPARPRVERSLHDAYQALTWSTVAVGLAVVLCVPVLLASGSRWAVVLGAGTLLVAALRTRPLPLAPQAAVAWASVAVSVVLGAVALLADHPARAALVLGALAVVVVVMVAVSPNAQQRARLRRWGDRFELLAVLVVVPSLLGVFGVYPMLLEVF